MFNNNIVMTLRANVILSHCLNVSEDLLTLDLEQFVCTCLPCSCIVLCFKSYCKCFPELQDIQFCFREIYECQFYFLVQISFPIVQIDNNDNATPSGYSICLCKGKCNPLKYFFFIRKEFIESKIRFY